MAYPTATILYNNPSCESVLHPFSAASLTFGGTAIGSGRGGADSAIGSPVASRSSTIEDHQGSNTLFDLAEDTVARSCFASGLFESFIAFVNSSRCLGDRASHNTDGSALSEIYVKYNFI